MQSLTQLKSKYENHHLIAPHIDLFSQTKGSKLTSAKRYSPITTLQVLDTFLERGFTVDRVHKTNATKEENKGYEKHEIVLNTPTDRLRIDGLRPKLHLRNSYNAQQALQFFLGVYRVVCSNGLVVGKGIFHERIIHAGNTDYKVTKALERSTNAYDLVAKNINEWTSFQLDDNQTGSLALRLLQLRLPKSDDKTKYYFNARSIDLATRVRRLEDGSNDLFTVFNRIQEKIIQRPSLNYIREEVETGIKQERAIRVLNGFQASQLNAQLWDETNNFYREIAA